MPGSDSVKNSRQRPRTCIACREESFRRVLIRIVRAPDGSVVLDERGKLSGRGAYLCARRECLEKARKTKALNRALKMEVPTELYDKIEEFIGSYREKHSEADVRKELHSLLGLSRRAGLVYIGTDSVKSQSTQAPLLILTAADCSESVEGMAARLADREGGGFVHFRLPLSGAELSAALGANGVQVIALPERNGLADKIKILLQEGGVALEQNESV